jgi:predicted transcriptional regulator
MVHKARTPDERFMICLFETGDALGDPYQPINKYVVGNKIGLHPRAVNAICQLLMRANFIKKRGEEEICLTEHGRSLVERLLAE